MTRLSNHAAPAPPLTTGDATAERPSAPRRAPLPRIGRAELLILAPVMYVFITAVDCGVTSPDNGGNVGSQDPRNCSPGQNDLWKNSGLTLSVVATNTAGTVTQTTCPYTISNRDVFIKLASEIRMPRSTRTYATPVAYPTIFNRYVPGQVIDYSPSGYLQYKDPSDTNQLLATLSSNNIQPGHYPDPNMPTWLWDSVEVRVSGIYSASPGDARAYRNSTGNIDNSIASLKGPTTLQNGVGGYFTMTTGSPSSGYTYKWVIDGTPVVNSAYHYNFFSDQDGTHTVTATLTRSDGTSQQRTAYVKVTSACGGNVMC